MCIRDRAAQPARGVAAFAVVALTIAVVGLPAPYKVGPLLTLAGLLGLLVCGGDGAGRQPDSTATGGAAKQAAGCGAGLSSLWQSLTLGGFILLIESMVVPVYLRASSGEHNQPWLRWALFGLLSLFGHEPAVGQSNVFVQTMRELHGFPVTTERLALLSVKTIFVGFLVGVALSPALRRSALRLISLGVVVTAIYTVVRYAVVVTAYLYLMHRTGYEDAANRVDVFWSPWWTAPTLLPIAWCLAALVPRPARSGRLDWFENVFGPAPEGARYLWAAATSAIVATVAFVVLIALPAPGSRKQGRVLVDEYHSQWEKTTRAFDTTWYGQEAGYNYYSIYDYLSRHYQTGRLEGPITTTTLRNCDVLIVKIPTQRFDETETRTIAQFVRDGGGLFLIGEHTNVFGSGVFINSLARMFGFEFRFDCLFDTARKFEQVYRPSRFLPHPIVQSVPLFFFQVSCSIKPLRGWAGS